MNLDLTIAFDEQEVEINSEWIASHPAELAASKINKESSSQNSSDDQVLKHLRKDVFTIPTLKQEGLIPLFNQLDDIIISITKKIIDSSGLARERILDVMVKVAAGNTYNKNIYEKNESSLEKRPNTTYKDHEIAFMNRCYNFLYNSCSDNNKISENLLEPQFVRGVYEEVLEEFVDKTKLYLENHHKSLYYKIIGDNDKYFKYHSKNIIMEEYFSISYDQMYSLVRDSEQALNRYVTIRSAIIAPYLRSAFSMAKKYGKNNQQLLDNFQNGSMGLIRAVSCYSTVRPTAFSSVAQNWIKQCMLLSIKEEANFVKLPIATWQAFTAMEKVRIKHCIEIDEYNEIAKVNKVPLDKVKSIYEAVKMSQVFSIHKTYDQNEKLTLEDVIPDESEDNNSMDSELREYIERSNLSIIERKVLSLVHGITDVIKSDIIDRLDIEKEQISQLARKIGFIVSF